MSIKFFYVLKVFYYEKIEGGLLGGGLKNCISFIIRYEEDAKNAIKSKPDFITLSQL